MIVDFLFIVTPIVGVCNCSMFLAIKHYLNPVGQPELDSESEIIWAKIDLPGLKKCFYLLFL